MPAEKIINYNQLIEKSTRNFTGRRWLREVLDEFLKAAGPRYFLMLGEPGCGKTAFMADLARRRGYPHHFFGPGSQIDLGESPDWRSMVRFAESLGYQLVRDYGGWVMNWEEWGIHVEQEVRQMEGLLVGARVGRYKAAPRPAGKPLLSVEQEALRFGRAARLIGVFIEKFEMDLEQVVFQLLTTPLQRIARRFPDVPLVIIADGLDEGGTSSAPGSGVVANLPDGSLPANVRFILSARPNLPQVEVLKRKARVVWLSHDERGRLEAGIDLDAQAFLENVIEKSAVPDLLKRHSIDPETFVEKVSRASQGNFLYLHHYTQGLLEGNEALLDLEALPAGLNAIYNEFLCWMRAQQDFQFWVTNCKPVLAVLAVAQAPLTRTQIAALSGIDRETVAAILIRLKQFLHDNGEGHGKRYAIYHASFGEYLLSEQNEDEIDGRSAHKRIASYYLDRYGGKWKDCDDDYGLDFTVQHILEAYHDTPELESLLKRIFKPQFMQVRSDKAGWHMPFVRDLQKVADYSPEQVIVPALQILEGSHRNSLVNQAVLRLLRKVKPELDARGMRIARKRRKKDKTIEDAISALSLPPDQAVPRLVKLMKEEPNPRIKAVLALALGEKECPLAIPALVDALVKVEKRSHDHVSWCAADALIALRSPASVESLLKNFHQPKVKPGVKQRIIYALGRMGAQLELDEARCLVEKGLALRGNLKGRALDFIYLYEPEDPVELARWRAEQEPVLWGILGFNPQDARKDRKPKWSDEWLQKRAVTALGRTGSLQSIPHLECLAQEVESRPPRVTKMLQQKRSELIKSLPRAIFELKQRHLQAGLAADAEKSKGNGGGERGED